MGGACDWERIVSIGKGLDVRKGGRGKGRGRAKMRRRESGGGEVVENKEVGIYAVEFLNCIQRYKCQLSYSQYNMFFLSFSYTSSVFLSIYLKKNCTWF